MSASWVHAEEVQKSETKHPGQRLRASGPSRIGGGYISELFPVFIRESTLVNDLELLEDRTFSGLSST